MDGVPLAARFSLATNRLKFCGPADAEPVLFRAITEGAALPDARRSLERFEALLPYLEAIGRVHGLDPFDRRVVEAYWVGNDLLDGVDRGEFATLLGALGRRGLPRSIVARLLARLPERPIPFHAFHVAYVGVGAVTGHVPTTLANMEACRPSWARVQSVGAGHLLLRQPSLTADRGRLSLGPESEIERAYDPRVLEHVTVGDWVAVHWGWPALRLDRGQRAAMERYTLHAIQAANEALPSMGVL